MIFLSSKAVSEFSRMSAKDKAVSTSPIEISREDLAPEKA